MTLPAPLAAWHHVVQSRDMAALGRLLADDVVFHSPVVHTPQRGKAITLKSTIWPSAFQRIRSMPLSTMPSISVLNSSMASLVPTISRS